jgi:hypothetical protein
MAQLRMTDDVPTMLDHPASSPGRDGFAFCQHGAQLVVAKRKGNRRPAPLNDIRLRREPRPKDREVLHVEIEEMHGA